jgi:hypothetical protein
VHGFARLQGQGTYCSVVKLLTLAGTITLDGTALTFADGIGPIFSDAGFTLAPSGRHLLDLGVELVGFFNYLAQFDPGNLMALSANLTCRSTAPSSLFSSDYALTVRVYTPCDARTDPSWCASAAGGLNLTVAHAEQPGVRFFGEVVSVTSRSAAGAALALSTYSYATHTDVTYSTTTPNVTLKGTTLADGTWGNCAALPNALPSMSAGGLFSSIIERGIPPVFQGGANVITFADGSNHTARRFTFTLTYTEDMVDPADASSGPALGTTLSVFEYFDDAVSFVPLRITVHHVYGTQPVPRLLFDITSFSTTLPAAPAWSGPTGFDDDDTLCPVTAGVVRSPMSLYPAATGDASLLMTAPLDTSNATTLLSPSGRRLQAVANPLTCGSRQYSFTIPLMASAALQMCPGSQMYFSISGDISPGLVGGYRYVSGEITAIHKPPSYNGYMQGCMSWGFAGYNQWPATTQSYCRAFLGTSFCQAIGNGLGPSVCGTKDVSSGSVIPRWVGLSGTFSLFAAGYAEARGQLYPRERVITAYAHVAVNLWVWRTDIVLIPYTQYALPSYMGLVA